MCTTAELSPRFCSIVSYKRILPNPLMEEFHVGDPSSRQCLNIARNKPIPKNYACTLSHSTDLMSKDKKCVGDKGSPLVCGSKIYGVLTEVLHCEVYHKAVYTTVGHLQKWFESHIPTSLWYTSKHKLSCNLRDSLKKNGGKVNCGSIYIVLNLLIYLSLYS